MNLWMKGQSRLVLSNTEDKKKIFKMWTARKQKFSIIDSVHASDLPYVQAPRRSRRSWFTFSMTLRTIHLLFCPPLVHMIKSSISKLHLYLICDAVPENHALSATEKYFVSPSLKIAEEPYELMTSNVKCVLPSDDPELSSRRYTPIATCSIFYLPSFLFYFVRSKPRRALTTSTAGFGDGFFIETIQMLGEESTM